MTMVTTCTDPARPTTATATSRRREDEDGSSRRLRECCMWMCRDQDSTRACRSSHVDVRASASQRKPAQASASQRKPAQAGASRRNRSCQPTHCAVDREARALQAFLCVACRPAVVQYTVRTKRLTGSRPLALVAAARRQPFGPTGCRMAVHGGLVGTLQVFISDSTPCAM